MSREVALALTMVAGVVSFRRPNTFRRGMLTVSKDMRPAVAAVAALMMVLLMSPSSAGAVKVDMSTNVQISPDFQSRGTGTVVYWSYEWTLFGSYAPTFYFGDGQSKKLPMRSAGGSGTVSHVFNTCVTSTYQQRLVVTSANTDTSQTRIAVSGPCLTSDPSSAN